MSIPDSQEKGNREERAMFFKIILGSMVILAIGVGSYALGYMLRPKQNSATSYSSTSSIHPTTKPAIHYFAASSTPATTISKTSSATSSIHMFVGSKSGKSYYLPNCPTVKRIKPENRVWFSSKNEAKEAGYKPSEICKEMKNL